MSLVSIHGHSEFSALDGYGRPKEMVARAVELGMPAVAITDHGTTAGWLAHRRAAEEAGVQPIYGAELYQARTHRKDRPTQKNARDSAHLILLAQTYDGYRNIMHLSDEASRSGFYYHPRVDWDLLEKYSKGVIATSACMAGLIAQGIKDDSTDYLNKFLNIFRENFYLEIHTYASQEQEAINRELWSIARKRSIPVVIANDAHYASPDQHKNHEILMSIQYNKQYLEDEPLHPPCLYIMGEDDVRNRLSYLSEACVDAAISATSEIADKCQYELPDARLHLPKFQGKKKSVTLLIDLAEKGIEELYGDNEKAWEQIEYELEAIIDAGLADYFLIVVDFINWCNRQGIMVGCGRGSVSGSILAYALGITSIDPIRYGLYFERFWNPGRTKGLPDIDVDIEETRREEVKDYLAQKYGEYRVLSIGAYSTMGPKAAVRRVMKALYGGATDYSDLDAISKILETTTDAGLVADWAKIDSLVGGDLKPYEERYPKVFEYAREFTDRITHYTTHASGVVVSDIDLPEELPCRQDRKEELLVTQVDMREVESQGFPKFDLLGLRTLSTLKKTVELAGMPNFDFRSINYNTLPDSYWRQIEKGNTLGFFQIEDGDPARRIGKEIKPRSIDDLAAIIALNRPGPLRSHATERYIKCRKGEATPSYRHPILEPILKETNGELIYQESILEYLKMIGYSLSEADEVRKILGKKLLDKMKEEEERYLSYASEFMNELTAREILDDIMEFALYSFNKAHAVGYGMVLAWTMYAKWKWPTEFIMASIITSEKAQDKQERVAKLVTEARRMGIVISPPDINYSDVGIGKIDDIIYFGLLDIKGIGRMAARWVIEHRPYASYEDFDTKFTQAQEEWNETKVGRSPKQILRSNQIEALYNAGAFDSLDDRCYTENMTLEEKAEWEEELLGIALTDVVGEIIRRNKHNFEELEPISALETKEGVLPVAGVITNIRKSRVGPNAYKNPGEEFVWVSIDWEGESTTFAAFPEEYRKYRFMLKPRVVGRFDLRTGKRGPVFMKGVRFV